MCDDESVLTVLGGGADHLLAPHATPHLGEGRHLDVVAGEGLQVLQSQLRVCGLLAEDDIRAWPR